MIKREKGGEDEEEGERTRAFTPCKYDSRTYVYQKLVDLLTGLLVDGSTFAPPRTTAFSIKARTRVKMLVYYIKRSLCVCLCVCVSAFGFLSVAHCVSICVPKSIYILNQQHLVCLMSKKIIEKIWPRGAQPPIYVKSFVLNRLGLCKCIMIKLYIF